MGSIFDIDSIMGLSMIISIWINYFYYVGDKKIISLELYEDYQQLESTLLKKQQQEQQEPNQSPTKTTTPISKLVPYYRKKIFLNDYILPALALQDTTTRKATWYPVMKFQFHSRMVQWLRKEYFICRYGYTLQHSILSKYPQIRYQSPSSTSHPNNKYILPSSSLLRKAFQMEHWNQQKGKQTSQQLESIPGTMEYIAKEKFIKPIQQQLRNKDTSSDENENLPYLMSLFDNTIKFITNIPPDTRIQIIQDPPIFEDDSQQSFSSTNSDTSGLQSTTTTTTMTTSHSTTTPPPYLLQLSIEDIIEILGGHINFCGIFNTYCELYNIYQIWTKEYIHHLAKYIIQQSQNKQKTQNQPQTIVLDIGAGDGLLTYFLNQEIQSILLSTTTPKTTILPKVPVKRKKGNPSRIQRPKSRDTDPAPTTLLSLPKVIAIDDKSWRIQPKTTVEKLNVEKAIQKYVTAATKNADTTKTTPDNNNIIILCSWMPMGVDWTKLFRNNTVSEYILIGECDNGTCGDNWETWGNYHTLRTSTASSHHDDGEEEDVIEKELLQAMSQQQQGGEEQQESTTPQQPTPQQPTPLYELDGYYRKDLDFLLPYQFSRGDCSLSKRGKTVTFIKK